MRRSLSFLRVTSLAMVSMLAGAAVLLAEPATITAATASAPGRGQGAGITGPGALFDVAALSARYAWAVGSTQVGSTLRPLIERWNGRTWTPVASPDPAGNDTLSSVAATSPSSAWAVGENGNRTLILHWNGRKWRQVRSPARGNLAGIAATSATNAWAVGLGGSHMVLEHWNGAGGQ